MKQRLKEMWKETIKKHIRKWKSQEVWQLDNRYLKLLKSIRELQRFLDKLAKFISSERKHNILEDKSKAKKFS